MFGVKFGRESWCDSFGRGAPRDFPLDCSEMVTRFDMVSSFALLALAPLWRQVLAQALTQSLLSATYLLSAVALA